MILLRATRLTTEVAAFADELAAQSGMNVAFLLDGRHPVLVPSERERVMVTDLACRGLGLFTPPDFAWRCGDYGLYLARQLFPEERHYWLVEYDIRLAGGSPRSFFTAFAARPEVDFLACEFGAADPTWWWRPTARGLGVKPHRCLFGIVRLSARALDHLVAKRRLHSRSVLRRKLWPNDEAFVATTLANDGFACADFNGFGATFYDGETLSLTTPIDGETFQPWAKGVKIYHPVLFGADFNRGNQTSVSSRLDRSARSFADVYRGRMLRGALALQPW